jgi:hypothetical protein
MKKTPLTYDELLAKLLTLSPEQLKQTVTVYGEENDEYYPTIDTATANSEMNDILDNGHFYLVF